LLSLLKKSGAKPKEETRKLSVITVEKLATTSESVGHYTEHLKGGRSK
jgi:hypothetical protein